MYKYILLLYSDRTMTIIMISDIIIYILISYTLTLKLKWLHIAYIYIYILYTRKYKYKSRQSTIENESGPISIRECSGPYHSIRPPLTTSHPARSLYHPAPCTLASASPPAAVGVPFARAP